MKQGARRRLQEEVRWLSVRTLGMPEAMRSELSASAAAEMFASPPSRSSFAVVSEDLYNASSYGARGREDPRHGEFLWSARS